MENKMQKIILTKINMGGSYRRNGGQRWTAQIDGKFIKWKKIIDGDDHILPLREAVLDLQSKFGVDVEIEVRAFVDPMTGYRDVPVHLYIENYGNVSHLRQEIIDYHEKQVDKIKREIVKGKEEFPFLMFGEE